MEKQYTDWGYVEWICEYEQTSRPMNIGIVTLLPGKTQNTHIHYGEDQFLYALSGRGEHVINGETFPFEPGDYFFMPDGVSHATFNLGSSEMKEILVSAPIRLNRGHDAPVAIQLPREVSVDLADVVEGMKDDFLKTLKIPLAIYDDGGHLLFHTDFPHYCCMNCIRSEEVHDGCDKVQTALQPGYKGINGYICERGLTVLMKTLSYKGKVLGHLRGGCILNGPSAHYLEYYDAHQGALNSMTGLYSDVAQYITDMCAVQDSRSRLLRQESEIRQEIRKNVELKDRLSSVERKMLNIRVNHHFLFNTLSAIAGSALDDNSVKTFDAIVELSDMFRHLLKKEAKYIRLREELGYLRNYVNLQALRFGSDLRVIWEIAPGIEEYTVPFNFLQPLVENSFVHAFTHKETTKVLAVSAEKNDRYLDICIEDNGTGISSEKLEALNRKKGKAASGVGIIRNKLSNVYGSDFTLSFTNSSGSGARVFVKIPVERHGSRVR